MDVSPEHLVEQARERFQLQDYYGAIHLLEEVVATGRAFADAHHMLGLSYSLVGQQDQALAQLDRPGPESALRRGPDPSRPRPERARS